MNINQFTIIILGACLFFGCRQDSIDAALIEEKVDKIIQEGLQAEAYPGAQVLVAKDGEIVFHKTYGHHTYNNKIPVQKDNLYDFASITKVTTGLPILMKLYGEGKFDLDAPLKKYFPKFKNSNKANLTFRAMLAHHAQLHPYIVYWANTLNKNGSFRPQTFEKERSKDYPIYITDNLYLHKNYKQQIYKAIMESPLNQDEGYKYSGLLFLLLPEIIEDLTGTNFETYLNETFYEPLGATTLTYNPLKKFPKERIIPTEDDTFFRKQMIQGTVHDEAAAMLGGVSCNAGLFGTAEDLAKLFQLYLNNGTYKGKRYITEKAIKTFTACQYCHQGNHRGLGFDKPISIPMFWDGETSTYVAQSASPKSFGHSGFTGTFVWADPKYNLLVIFLSNRVYPTRKNRNLYKLDIRPRIHQAVYDAME